MKLANTLIVLGALGGSADMADAKEKSDLERCTDLANRAEEKVRRLADDIRVQACEYASTFYTPMEGLSKEQVDFCLQGPTPKGAKLPFYPDRNVDIKPSSVDSEDCQRNCDRIAAEKEYACSKPIEDDPSSEMFKICAEYEEEKRQDCLMDNNCEGDNDAIRIAKQLVRKNSNRESHYEYDDFLFTVDGFDSSIENCSTAVEERLNEIDRLGKVKGAISAQTLLQVARKSNPFARIVSAVKSNASVILKKMQRQRLDEYEKRLEE